MDAAEVALVRSSLEAALRDTAGRAALAALADAGFAELVAAEPMVAVAELFEAQGRVLSAAPALDLVVAAALGLELSAGEALVHPTLEAWDGPPGIERADGDIAVDGLVAAGLPAAGRILVPCRGAGGGLVVVEVDAARLDADPIGGFDGSLGLVRLRGTVAAPARRVAGGGWEDVARVARRAVAHELVGVAQEALDVAGRHVTDRIQFGKPIAAFQTVRHRLTEVYVALASARAALEATWSVDDPVAADAAKALAGQAALLAGKHCLQVTGAIGFSWDYGLHRRIRRARVLDGLYGGHQALTVRIGGALLSDRCVPRVRSLP